MIRYAKAKDLQRCAALSRIEELQTPEGDYPSAGYLKAFLGKGLFLVAEENKKVLGYIAGEALNGKTAYLNCLAVDAKERGKGIGTMLLAAFKKRARNKARMIFVFAPKSNQRSMRFYKKNGLVKGKEYVFFSKSYR